MKKLIPIILVMLLAFSAPAMAAGTSRTITVGSFMLEADSSWVVQTVSDTHINVINNTGDIVCSVQFYDYSSGFGMSYDQLLATASDDYGIAQLILDSLYSDSAADMFGTLDSDTLQVGAVCGLYYYGDLNPNQYDGRYSGTLLVHSTGVLSMMSLTTTSGVGITELFDFDEQIIRNLYVDGVNIFDTDSIGDSSGSNTSGGTTGADALAAIGGYLDNITTPAQPAADAVSIAGIDFVTPEGWTFVSSNEYQIIYSHGSAAISLNAYAHGVLMSGMDAYSQADLADILIAVAQDSLSQTGADPSAFTFTTTNLENNDLVVYFEGNGGAAMNNSYMTSAMFITPDYTTGLITILTPGNDTAANSELLAQCINMYYPSPVISASAIPHGSSLPVISVPSLDISGLNTNSTTAASTPAPATANTGNGAAANAAGQFNLPNAAVLSSSGPSLTGDEMSALGAAITYVSGGSWTYDSLVEQLLSDGYSYEAAVFAADNCGQW